MKKELDRSGGAAAAIIFLGYVPGLSVEILRQVLQLSHPGTVRLIDRLEEGGLVERCGTDDGRAVALYLKPKGKELRDRLLKRRLDTLESALHGLTANERLTFGKLIAKTLASLPKTEIDKYNVCRLCAVQVCSNCPIPGNSPIVEKYIKDNPNDK